METSQRIVDVALRAFAQITPDRVCAACQGTMNNITIGGPDPRTGGYFTFYETIAGGFGARPNKDGTDGIHSHMTNTLNTWMSFFQMFELQKRDLETFARNKPLTPSAFNAQANFSENLEAEPYWPECDNCWTTQTD